MNDRLESKTVSLSVNGQVHTVVPKKHSSLLAYLRNELQLTGTKQGCETGNCGACTVLVNDYAVQSCQLSLTAAEGLDIKTIDGIIETPLGKQITNTLTHHDAAQCGYCLPGIVMAAYDEVSNADKPDALNALQRNLCRCGTHTRILKALREVIMERAAKR